MACGILHRNIRDIERIKLVPHSGRYGHHTHTCDYSVFDKEFSKKGVKYKRMRCRSLGCKKKRDVKIKPGGTS
jgi:hypothetical protein